MLIFSYSNLMQKKKNTEYPEIAHSHRSLPSDPELRVRAIETLLLKKQLIKAESIDTIIDLYENKIGPINGSKVIARAWVDEKFKDRLLSDARSAIQELPYIGQQGYNIIAVENTNAVHNLVVCTLCSCYPWSLLGIPPSWYKSDQYRARVVREPRKVLAEFGLKLPEDSEIRVWDSTSELRYLVVPEKPEEANGFDEEELVKHITRDAMIGTALVEVS